MALAAFLSVDEFIENLDKTSSMVKFERKTYHDVFTGWYNAKATEL